MEFNKHAVQFPIFCKEGASHSYFHGLYLYTPHTHTRTLTHMHTLTHACTLSQAHAHACTHSCMHTPTHAHAHACTPSHMHSLTQASSGLFHRELQGRRLDLNIALLLHLYWSPEARRKQAGGNNEAPLDSAPSLLPSLFWIQREIWTQCLKHLFSSGKRKAEGFNQVQYFLPASGY